MGACFDLLRVLAASVVFFWAMPYYARRVANDAPTPWEQDVVPSFIRAALFFQLNGVTLGCWNLGYPGAVIAILSLWIAADATFASDRRNTLDPAWWHARAARCAFWIEVHGWRGAAGRIRDRIVPILSRPHLSTMALIALVGLTAHIAFPLLHQRFLDIGTYSRAISLQRLVHGQDWYPDTSVGFLIPLAHFSGVDATGVIRWTGPLFLSGAALGLAYCAWVWTRSLAAACFAPMLFEGYQRWLVVRPAGEASPADIAAVFWLLAGGLMRTSRANAAGAVLLALSVQFRIPAVLAPALAALLLGAALAWLGRFLPFAATKARVPAIALCGVMLYAGGPKPPDDGPVQYEAAARAAARIATERPRNRYLLVSPALESVAVYGRGWHEELADFVHRFHPAVPMRPDFRFQYPVPEMFVFVEKQPLPQPEAAPASTFDTNSYYYYTRLGRTALQFQAARIMASYSRTHPGTSIYYEDDCIVVYQVRLEPPAAPGPGTAGTGPSSKGAPAGG
jgi:hypothetical protein